MIGDYFPAKDAAREAGISRPTLLRVVLSGEMDGFAPDGVKAFRRRGFGKRTAVFVHKSVVAALREAYSFSGLEPLVPT